MAFVFPDGRRACAGSQYRRPAWHQHYRRLADSNAGPQQRDVGDIARPRPCGWDGRDHMRHHRRRKALLLGMYPAGPQSYSCGRTDRALSPPNAGPEQLWPSGRRHRCKHPDAAGPNLQRTELDHHRGGVYAYVRHHDLLPPLLLASSGRGGGGVCVGGAGSLELVAVGASTVCATDIQFTQGLACAGAATTIPKLPWRPSLQMPPL